MPLEIRTNTIALNETKSFTFSDVIGEGQYVVGASTLSLWYPGHDQYDVQTLSISFAHGMQNSRTVFVTMVGEMDDGVGHVQDPASNCVVNVIAWLGTADKSALYMTNLTGVSEETPATFTAPAGAQQIFTMLAGVRVALPKGQKVTSYSASTSSSGPSIDGTVTVTGNSRINGYQGTVNVGVLVYAADLGYQIFTAASDFSKTPPSIKFVPAVMKACACLTSFGGVFPHDGVNRMEAGATVAANTSYPATTPDVKFAMDILGGKDHAGARGVNACLIGTPDS